MTNGSYEKAFRQRFYDTYSLTPGKQPDYLMDTRDVRYFGKPDWADDYYQSSLLYNVNASIGGGSKKRIMYLHSQRQKMREQRTIPLIRNIILVLP